MPRQWYEDFYSDGALDYELLASAYLSDERSPAEIWNIPGFDPSTFQGSLSEGLGLYEGVDDEYSAAQERINYYSGWLERERQRGTQSAGAGLSGNPSWTNRDAEIFQSLSSDANPLRSSVTLSASDLGLNQKAPIYNNHGTVQLRGKPGNSGQFSSGIGSYAKGITPALRETVVSILTRRYTDLGIGKPTGTLFDSLQQSEVVIDEDSEKGFVVHVQPASLKRESRWAGDKEESTDNYGSWVYQGRRAIVPRHASVLRFQIDGHWVHAKSVRGTGPKDVFDLSSADKERIATEAGKTFVSQVVNSIQFS